MKYVWTLLIFALLVSCNQVSDSQEELKPAKYEITEVDIFSKWQEGGDFTGEEVSVMGVQIGHDSKQVISILGPPANFTKFAGEGIVLENFEYRESLGSEKTSLIIHLQNDRVERVTIRAPFNSFLVNKTKVNGTDDDFYFNLGIPDGKEIVFRFILLNYDRFGLDIITFRSDVVGFTLRKETETVRNVSSEIIDYVKMPYSDEIILK